MSTQEGLYSPLGVLIYCQDMTGKWTMTPVCMHVGGTRYYKNKTVFYLINYKIKCTVGKLKMERRIRLMRL
jgi:hypothetical protein